MFELLAIALFQVASFTTSPFPSPSQPTAADSETGFGGWGNDKAAPTPTSTPTSTQETDTGFGGWGNDRGK